MNPEIKNLLEKLHKMSQSEDWDESSAQMLVQWGGELYEKYFLNQGAEITTGHDSDIGFQHCASCGKRSSPSGITSKYHWICEECS